MATGVVVELDEQRVELGMVDELLELEPLVRCRALGSGSDPVGAAAAQLLDHPDPWLLVR